MVASWNEIKNRMKTWGSVAAEKAEELGKVAATKTEELTKISKVKLEIHQLQRDLDKQYTKLGKFVFDGASRENLTNFAGNEQFFAKIKQAQDLISKIKQKEERVEEIKKEYESAPQAEEEETEKEVDTSESESSDESKPDA